MGRGQRTRLGPRSLVGPRREAALPRGWECARSEVSVKFSCPYAYPPPFSPQPRAQRRHLLGHRHTAQVKAFQGESPGRVSPPSESHSPPVGLAPRHCPPWSLPPNPAVTLPSLPRKATSDEPALGIWSPLAPNPLQEPPLPPLSVLEAQWHPWTCPTQVPNPGMGAINDLLDDHGPWHSSTHQDWAVPLSLPSLDSPV